MTGRNDSLLTNAEQPDDGIAHSIGAIISDVDGVLSDGRISYTADGHEIKSFHARDGLGIKLWTKAGYRFAIITARGSDMVRRRAEELGLSDVHQDVADKWACASALMSRWELTPREVAYIGDDLPDLAVMTRVGLSAAPADAALDVRQQATWVLNQRGGQGAVRELIERLMRATGQWRAMTSGVDPSLGSDGRRC